MKITSKAGYVKLLPNKTRAADPIILEKVGAVHKFKTKEDAMLFSQSINSMHEMKLIEWSEGVMSETKEEPKVEVKKEEPKVEVKKEEPKVEVKKEEPKGQSKQKGKSRR